jgi:hypothetical protein
MAPDGIGTLGAATGLLTFASMDGLEVVDIAIGLVEVAVAIIVVAIPDIEFRQVGIDLGGDIPWASWALYQALTESPTNSQVRAQTIPPQ